MEEPDEDTKGSKILDNADEISWVIYGIMATICMVVYQFFLVQFFNVPSTISSKIAMSTLIGFVVIIVYFVIWITSRSKHYFEKKRLRSLPSQEVKLQETPQWQKKSLWSYATGAVSNVKRSKTLTNNIPINKVRTNEESKDHYFDEEKRLMMDLKQPLLEHESNENILKYDEKVQYMSDTTPNQLPNFPYANVDPRLKDSNFDDSKSHHMQDKRESTSTSKGKSRRIKGSSIFRYFIANFSYRSETDRTLELQKYLLYGENNIFIKFYYFW